MLKTFFLQIGDHPHFALHHADNALRTAADLFERLIVPRDRADLYAHQPHGFPLPVNLHDDFLAVLGGLFRPLSGKRVFGALRKPALLYHTAGYGADQRGVVHWLKANRNNGGRDIGNLGKPLCVHLLRITDQSIDFSDVLPDGQAVLLKFQPNRGNHIQQGAVGYVLLLHVLLFTHKCPPSAWVRWRCIRYPPDGCKRGC